jgi:glycosyltransferase involved in cell wall biosynthesis
VGWNLCVHLATQFDLTILCSPGEPPRTHILRDEIAEYERQFGPVPGLAFHFVELPVLSYLFQRESLVLRRTLYYVGYWAWQRAAYRAAIRLHRERPFDLTHQLNITGFREPGYLWKLSVPFVWGPIGGAANVPLSFLPLMSWSERTFYALRNLLNSVQKHTLLRCRRAARRAGHIWTIGEADRTLVEEVWGCAAEPMAETGTSTRAELRPKHRDTSKPLRLVWAGQHVGRKMLPVLLQALRSLRDAGGAGVELVVVGQGPETDSWRALAAELGLADRIRWTGWLPYRLALAEIESADALVFTGVQEGTPHVVLEALSRAVPVVCHDACGMGVAVTSACGLKIPLRDPATSIRGFAEAIHRLAADPRELARLSAGALERARELTWEAKARRIAGVYASLLRSREPAERAVAAVLEPRRHRSVSTV